tara:strand:- start:19052 stop:20326 length:1275 start_codon:yes stop_codon:yes gene_type:complete
MGKKSTPAVPDYRGAAEEQAESSRLNTEQQTWANRPDQYTPFGSQTWQQEKEWDPTTKQYLNKWAQTTNLDPESQAALDAQQRIGAGRSQLAESLLGRVNQEYGDIIDWDNFPAMSGGLTAGQYQPQGNIQSALDFSSLQDIPDVEGVRNRAESAMYERGASRLDPQYEQEEDKLRTRLLNQGFQEGDKGFQNEIDRFSNQKSDDYANLRRDSIAMGGDEATRQFGMGMQGRQQGVSELTGQGQFGNQAVQQMMAQQLGLGGARFGEAQQAANFQNQLRQQGISEEQLRRGMTLNEINAILSGQQVALPGMPGFNTASKSETTQYMDAADRGFQGEMDVQSMKNAATQGMMSGAAGMMSFSDRRLKRDIKRIGTLLSGLPLYTFEYIWGEKSVGVMAQDVLEVIPDAVHEHPSGYLMVDYGAIA